MHHPLPLSVGRLCLRVALTLPVLLSLPATNARILHVRPAGSAAEAYWDAAYTDLPQAISSAQAGDEVWVAAGVYTTRISLREGVGLYGGFTGTETERSQRDWRRNRTVLDGEALGAVVTARGVTPSAVLDGFTVCNGFGPNTPSNPSGGGLNAVLASPTIRNNVFIRNYALNGGAIFCSGGAAIIENNRIIGNHADYGAAIYCMDSSVPVIRNNAIQGNSGSWGGLYVVGSSPTVVGNSFTGNYGTAIGFTGTVAPIIANNLIAFNGRGVSLPISGRIGGVFRNNAVFGNELYPYFGPEPDQWMAHNITADPHLVNVAEGVIHLLPYSPLVDAGDASLADIGDRDLDGQPRVQGGGVDIGADESDGVTRVWTPRVMRVRPDGDDARDGLSWETARRTIQSAVDDAMLGGGEVWVAEGVYAENVVQGPYVRLFGGFAGTETELPQRDAKAHPTHIDAGRKGSALRIYSGVLIALVDGFTLRNGFGTTWYGGSQRSGGGLFARYANAVITNNVIRDNMATVWGGGLMVDGRYFIIEGNTITGNSLTTPSQDYVGGGGIYATGTEIAIRDNDISRNSAGNGGAILLAWGKMIVERNRITDNRAFSSNFGGGGITVYDATANIAANTLTDNATTGNGGGIRSVGTSGGANVYHCLLAGNQAVNGGGAYQAVGAALYLSSNTIVANTATAEGGGLYLVNAPVRGSLLALNSSGIYTTGDVVNACQYNGFFSNGDYDFIGIIDHTSEWGNLKADPLFVDAASGDYRLTGSSPMIDAYPGISVSPGARDLVGNPRKMGRDLDIGAYEFMPDGAFTIDDVRRALALFAGLAPVDEGDARLNLHVPEAPGIEMGDVLRLARKAMGWERNP